MTPDRIDTNQSDIVRALRKIPGISVSVGHDDCLIGYKGKTYWFEIKNPEAVSPKTGKIRPSAIKVTQYKLLETWKGHYEVIWKIEQILDTLGIRYAKKT